jgi:hypothetical protein
MPGRRSASSSGGRSRFGRDIERYTQDHQSFPTKDDAIAKNSKLNPSPCSLFVSPKTET